MKPKTMPPAAATFRKFCFHIGTSSSMIQTAVEEATIATRLLLT